MTRHRFGKDLAMDLARGAPRPGIAVRAGVAGSIARRLLWILGYDDHEVFWTRRRWPDQ